LGHIEFIIAHLCSTLSIDSFAGIYRVTIYG
jgi:hypothetical protein